MAGAAHGAAGTGHGQALRGALAGDELRVHYRPVVGFDRSELLGVDATVPWEHPDRGALDWRELADVAEDAGLSVALGQWLLRRACAQAARWAYESSGSEPSVAVDLPGALVAQSAVVAVVAGALDETGLRPERLVLTVDEGTLLARADDASVFRALRVLGVRVGAGGVGAGSESRGALDLFDRLPVDVLRLDATLVATLGARGDRADTVAAIVRAGHERGLLVTADGVGSARQVSELRSLGCDAGQGPYFARPQPGEVVAALVRRPLRWRQLDPVA